MHLDQRGPIVGEFCFMVFGTSLWSTNATYQRVEMYQELQALLTPVSKKLVIDSSIDVASTTLQAARRTSHGFVALVNERP